jgi:hypothetical protein
MSATVSAVVVPMDESKPLYSVAIPASFFGNDDLEAFTRNLQESNDNNNSLLEGNPNIRQRLLVRTAADGTAGLYAYDVLLHESSQEKDLLALNNVRATKLAMACGQFSCCKSWGNALLVRASIASRVDLDIYDDGIHQACCISPDLRTSIQQQIQDHNNGTGNNSINNEHSTVKRVPTWLGNALQQNYHDKAVLGKLAEVMTIAGGQVSVDESDDDDDDGQGTDSESPSSSPSHARQPTPTIIISMDAHSSVSTTTTTTKSNMTKFVTKQPLCLHCRRPANTLCAECKACYFCDTPPERQCRKVG